MSIGEVIALLTRYATEYDTLLLRKGIFSIECGEDYIDVVFSDGNTEDIRIFFDGRWGYIRDFE